MANKNLFMSDGSRVPAANTKNAAGGRAYEMSAKQALAQIAATNTFNSTFYVGADENLKIAKDAAMSLSNDPEFIAKAAVYSRTKSYMKDMPAFLTVILAGLDTKLFRKVFPLVIDNGKMLRNFVQIGRSGQTGRVFNMSASACRKAIRHWFDEKSAYSIFRSSVGNDPSMHDILRMARPRPNTEEKAALFAYLLGARFDKETRSFKMFNKDGSIKYEQPFDKLPQIVREYENYKNTKTGTVPNVDFRMLDSLGLGDAEWTDIARNAGWQMTRMNLNTFARHGVFNDKELVQIVADRLRNPELIAKSRAFPYQLMSAYLATTGGLRSRYGSNYGQPKTEEAKVPHEITEALQDAMELAIDNVPVFDGPVYIAVDTSGSMGSAVTGYRRGSTSSVRCVDAAALFAAAILRKNKNAEIIPFDTTVHTNHSLNGRDTVMTNAKTLAAFGGGGTNCSCALKYLNSRRAKGRAVIYISDYESWVDSGYHYYGSREGTSMLSEWKKFHSRNKDAKLICMDLTPRGNSQVTERENILQVGGFSDSVFEVIDSFIRVGNEKNHWVAEIESINLDEVGKDEE
jgi:60 kDa SS-A/Ro ribonucleoprotein